MTNYKTIVCLANSRKEGGCCIVGKEIIDGQLTHHWIRPVSELETGELLKRYLILYDEKWPQWLSFLFRWLTRLHPQPDVLDVITIPLIQPQPHAYQRENYLVDMMRCWFKQRKLLATELEAWCDAVTSLWRNGYHSFNGFNDRIPVEIATRDINTSLLLIKPDNVSLLVEKAGGRVKIRMKFSFHQIEYRLVLTDPKVESIYRLKPAGEYSISKQVYLCVSLGEPFQGYCYKLVASLINC